MSGLEIVTLVAALGSGLVAGVFFAFSAFVMPALDRLPPGQGIAAMQSINRLAVTALFMAALFGTALACLGLLVWALVTWSDGPSAWVVAGSALYVTGAVAVTLLANVPRNDALAELEPSDAAAAGWRAYVKGWSAWNHLRTVAGLGAATLLAIALAEPSF